MSDNIDSLKKEVINLLQDADSYQLNFLKKILAKPDYLDDAEFIKPWLGDSDFIKAVKFNSDTHFVIKIPITVEAEIRIFDSNNFYISDYVSPPLVDIESSILDSEEFKTKLNERLEKIKEVTRLLKSLADKYQVDIDLIKSDLEFESH